MESAEASRRTSNASTPTTGLSPADVPTLGFQPPGTSSSPTSLEPPLKQQAGPRNADPGKEQDVSEAASDPAQEDAMSGSQASMEIKTDRQEGADALQQIDGVAGAASEQQAAADLASIPPDASMRNAPEDPPAAASPSHQQGFSAAAAVGQASTIMPSVDPPGQAMPSARQQDVTAAAAAAAVSPPDPAIQSDYHELDPAAAHHLQPQHPIEDGPQIMDLATATANLNAAPSVQASAGPVREEGPGQCFG